MFFQNAENVQKNPQTLRAPEVFLHAELAVFEQKYYKSLAQNEFSRQADIPTEHVQCALVNLFENVHTRREKISDKRSRQYIGGSEEETQKVDCS